MEENLILQPSDFLTASYLVVAIKTASLTIPRCLNWITKNEISKSKSNKKCNQDIFPAIIFGFSNENEIPIRGDILKIHLV